MKYKTKRFLYNTIQKNVLNKPGCYCIVGSRKIGKTVLLQQLQESNKDNTIYIDASVLPYKTNFKEVYEKWYKEGIRNIFLDEVCKMNDDLIASFISETHNFSDSLCFILSGSVSLSVRRICRDIGRGEEYEMPPIMYIERLCWENGINEINAEDVKNLSSYDKYISYIKTENTISNQQGLYYIADVVGDTLRSYLRGTYLGDNKLDMSVKSIYDAIKYISLCQCVYKSINKDKKEERYISIPNLEQNEIDYLKNAYKVAKRNWDLSQEEISYVLSLLYGCGLAKKTRIYRGSSLSVENLSLDTNYVDACIFEYPWLGSLFLSPKLQENFRYVAMWVENSVLLRESYIYPFYDKYRDRDGFEIDTVYQVDFGGFYGLEVKNRKASNVERHYIRDLITFSEGTLGLEKIELTCSDDPKENNRYKDRFLRIDKVIASMELEYMNIVDSGDVYSCLNVNELIKKHFG